MPIVRIPEYSQQPEAYIGNAASLFDREGSITNEDTRKFLKSFMEAFASMDREEPTGPLKKRRHQGREGFKSALLRHESCDLYGTIELGATAVPAAASRRVRPPSAGSSGLVATRTKRLGRS